MRVGSIGPSNVCSRACAASAATADDCEPTVSGIRAKLCGEPLCASVRRGTSTVRLVLAHRFGWLGRVVLNVLRAAGGGGAARGLQGREDEWVHGAAALGGSKSQCARRVTAILPRLPLHCGSASAAAPRAGRRAATSQPVARPRLIRRPPRPQMALCLLNVKDGNGHISTK